MVHFEPKGRQLEATEFSLLPQAFHSTIYIWDVPGRVFSYLGLVEELETGRFVHESVGRGRRSILGRAQFLRQFADSLFVSHLPLAFRVQIVFDAVHLPTKFSRVRLQLLATLYTVTITRQWSVGRDFNDALGTVRLNRTFNTLKFGLKGKKVTYGCMTALI